jgi:hypothetical protein
VRVVRSDSIDDARVEELRGLEMAILSRHRVESQRDGAVVWFRKIEHGLTIKGVNVNIRHLLRREDWASQLLRREISGQIAVIPGERGTDIFRVAHGARSCCNLCKWINDQIRANQPKEDGCEGSDESDIMKDSQ